MAHGTKDYGNVQQKKTVYRLDDMAELAVRVGAVPSIDRLGDVIFIDSFESGLGKWAVDTFEAIHTVEISGDIYKTGGFSCKLINVASIQEYCGAACGTSFFLGDKIGFEFSFAGDIYGKKIKISIGIYDGENLLTGEVVLDIVGKTLSYYNAAGAFIVFATGIKVVQNEYDWNTWKLIMDIDDEKYVRLILNQYVYSLVDILLNKTAYSSAPFISSRFYMMQTQTVATTLYIDDCILTQNEP